MPPLRFLGLYIREIVTEDPSSRFHIFSGFPKLYERASAKLAEARSKLESEPLIIFPLAHDEDYLESGSQTQKQRKKLLDIDMEVPLVATTDTHTVTLCCCLMCEELALDSANSKMEPIIESSSVKRQFLSLSPAKNLPITLFGRARLSSQEFDQLHERKAIHTQYVYTKTSPELEKVNLEEVVESLQDDTKEETVEKESCRSFFSSSSSSSKDACKDLSGDLRKLYRSMNAPVPRPLPSLMELMNARKRSRNH